MTSIGEQLDMAAGAWLREKRGPDGKWTKGNFLSEHQVQGGGLRHAIVPERYEMRPGGGGKWIPPLEQETLPGMPHALTPWEQAAADLDKDRRSGFRRAQSPKDRRHAAGVDDQFFGNSAQTSMVTFGNGHRWIHKEGLSSEEMDREKLMSRLSDAITAGAPDVIVRDGSMWEPAIPDAKTAIEWMGGMSEDGDPLNGNDPYDMYSSIQGAKIGVLDTIGVNRDRHEGNWMVRKDRWTGEEEPVPIDHGRAMMDDDNAVANYGYGPFSENLLSDENLGYIPAGAWDIWRGRISNLEPSFISAEMPEQFRVVMKNFDDLAARAADIRESSEDVTPEGDISAWT